MKKICTILLLIGTSNIFCSVLKYDGPSQKVLVFGGKTGWFGQFIVKQLHEWGHQPIIAQSRLENRVDLIREINKVSPDAIINAAGITGRPHIDWCEDHKPETIRANVIGSLNLADISHELNIHMTYIGTGCLYDYDQDHSIESGKGFTEQDPPNHDTSFYCESKLYLQKLLVRYPNVLLLRVRMPFSGDWNPRNFIVKIATYERVINIPNALSCLEDLLPIAADMTLRKLKGIYNFVNPGVISHNQILDLYKGIVDPSFTYHNFSIEQQDNILKAPRSNCALDTSKLMSEYPEIPDVKQSIINALIKMKELNH